MSAIAAADAGLASLDGCASFATCTRFDMHVHLEAMKNRAEIAAEAARSKVALLNVTVTPQNYLRDRELLARAPTVRTALGFHPWWVEPEREKNEPALRTFEELVAHERFVGEVGLDFGLKHAATADEQLRVFERIAHLCGHVGGKVLSIHAVKSTGIVLDVLEKTGCTRSCTCILHWYSGTSDELVRARRLGCFFSVGEPMLHTKRGREYVKSVPAGRLLLETDLPATWNAPFELQGIVDSLDVAQAELMRILSTEKTSRIPEASRNLLV